ncbi:type I restriction endonuclease subunit R [Tenacibaculum finnmarkense]|uniref:type I restriction endonuclease subunit R n=1 Tax=Tenacibaculum finnmarkense TaxID=2781243 RepID=UPI00187B5650|nr:type I restriction endonuclease [Tenacibaculum finnmarkense]MBE7632980.1 DEAD/DEAH box helicase family protein [Tenacibaculum finnmarkense genomovar ulcerans]MBE7697060.1 DEAD/DEAH box helicase family protein [Tenacibaculum finnmarkense genomovar ulcerans]MCD8428898.1 DEAD/DEAH box helicase family protein [Tenacibaculum finnmarkense genomovar ulcerans]
MKKSLEYIDSELPAIELFKKLGYQYYNASEKKERENISEVLLKTRLESAIKRINPWINEVNCAKAITALTAVNGASLMENNEQIWELLRGGNFTVKQVINSVEVFKPVYFVDYNTPENNDFLVVNQMRFKNRLDTISIPDLVVFLNGLPISVIECKSASSRNAWDSAFSDLKEYENLNEKLFYYNQINVGIWGVGAKYGGVNAPQQFYSVFKTSKEDTEIIEKSNCEQDKLIRALFKKERLLDIIRHFVIFETSQGITVKKLPRYQQIRATNKTISRLQSGEGGVVWHTQGSGKSLTMAYIARKLQAPEFGFKNPTVLILTDRKDLDRQINTTFRNVGFKNVNQASSVVHLDGLLRNDYGGIITSTIQKFQEKDPKQTISIDQTELEESGNLKYEKHIKDRFLIKITKELKADKWVEIEREEIPLEELSNKENLYVLVDEAHRSHYGFLASFMRTVLPQAKFVAFTGTPISKQDKSTLNEFYGGDYIDVYTLTQAVADKATLPLLYDEGIAKLSVKKEALDKEFEEEFGHLSEAKKDKLKNEALQKHLISEKRINDISKHLITHYRTKIYKNGHKAMLVCSGRKHAIRYQEALDKLKKEGFHNFETKVIISLGSVKKDAIAKEYYETLKWNEENPKDKKPIFVVPTNQIKEVTDNFKLPFGEISATEKSGKKKHDNTAIIIVSDMLLTGWDAPIASCLYLDKSLKEHNLLQAIARVNRTRKGKEVGLIMDYNGITSNLIEALEIFSGDIKPEDILRNINEELPKLAMNHHKLVDFFKPIKIDSLKNRKAYIDKALLFIEPLDKRDTFKVLLKAFKKSMSIVLPNKKALKYQYDFKLFNDIKLTAKNFFPDDDELKTTKEESEILQAMVNEHLTATGVENLLDEPISITDKDKFKAEIMNASPATKELKMRTHLKHTIKVGIDKNPDFYKPLAQRLEELFKLKAAERIGQLELFKAYSEIQDEIINQQKEGEEKGFKTTGERAIYDSMKVLFAEDAQNMTKTMFDMISKELEIIDWQEKGRVRNDIEKKVKNHLKTAKIADNQAKIKAKEMIAVLIKNL